MNSIYKVGDKVWNLPRAWGEIIKFEEEEKLFHVRFTSIPSMTFFFDENGKEVIQRWQYSYKKEGEVEYKISACDYATDFDFKEMNNQISFSDFKKVPESKQVSYPEDSIVFSNIIEKEINLNKVFEYYRELLEYIHIQYSMALTAKKSSEKEENATNSKIEVFNLIKFTEIMLGKEKEYDKTKIRSRQLLKSVFDNKKILI